MERPTAEIRRLLLLGLLRDYIQQEIAHLKDDLKKANLSISEIQTNELDITVKFVNNGMYDQGIYMRKMLDAEIKNRAKRTGLII
ncbi:hypothetical protein [Alicyclobacillus acidoterrestris]|uniref:Uncharacterized protein n=1 Tax=Alicyclobacillus acidoterrestris (strain ATCC 49025 / DSM 3922 / CIP 106132 / NCIMB 13137 / GD3B) TaxID=1356854 RepID=T0DGF9_ALIAG|nr:hypothetical protein [Alicyclobacillus acidoterrestris]EPZ48671.1 hypothetical protein N007_21485 [Alicyclobacillus acidoterrestris ATCC 49025]UNO49415.1 hypothetical protein K1I37_02360 [Alicyclobacillus acidoterrestris]